MHFGKEQEVNSRSTAPWNAFIIWRLNQQWSAVKNLQQED